MGNSEGKTAQRVKVYRPGDRGREFEEVEVDEAKRIIAEARAKGRLVINKGIGEVIEDLKPDVEELLIVDIVEGG